MKLNLRTWKRHLSEGKKSNSGNKEADRFLNDFFSIMSMIGDCDFVEMENAFGGLVTNPSASQEFLKKFPGDVKRRIKNLSSKGAKWCAQAEDLDQEIELLIEDLEEVIEVEGA